MKSLVLKTAAATLTFVSLASTASAITVRAGQKVTCAEASITGFRQPNKIFDTLAQGTIVKMVGYTSENSYAQPFEVYVVRAWDGQVAQLRSLDFPVFHEHSAAISWKTDDFGNLSIQKERFTTGRSIKVNSLEVISEKGGVNTYLNCR